MTQGLTDNSQLFKDLPTQSSSRLKQFFYQCLHNCHPPKMLNQVNGDFGHDYNGLFDDHYIENDQVPCKCHDLCVKIYPGGRIGQICPGKVRYREPSYSADKKEPA